MASPGVVRAFRAADEHVVARLRHQSFSAPTQLDLWLEHGYVLEVDGAPAGALLARRCGQWFGGRSVPCVTISSVMVDLPRRGGGVMGHLLAPVLQQHADAGAAIATLTPSAAAPYRRAGFEVAGYRYRHHVPAHSLRAGTEYDDVAWYEPNDADQLAEVYDAAVMRDNGLIDRDPAWWRGHILPPLESGNTFAVVARRNGAITGYSLWDQLSAPRGEFTFRHRVRAREIVWTTPSSAAGLLRALAQAGSPGEELAWFGGPAEPLVCLFDEPVGMDWVHPWMTKILDVPAALAARGYPAHVETTLVVSIPDWSPDPKTVRLRVRDGRAEVEEAAATADVTIQARALASVFTSRSSARQLAALGKVRARSEQALDDFDAIFTGPGPWFLEHF